MELIRAMNVKRGFPYSGGTFWALKGISLTVEEGQLCILKGRSGSGKTTLINILGALDYPTEGEVYFENLNITKTKTHDRDLIHREKMSFVFQSVALISMMTVYENVEFSLRIANVPINQRKKRVEECLSMVGLSQRINHLPAELSGGEQQRVAIARAIAHRPKVIFADEPTAELDTNTGLQVVQIFKDLIRKENTTIVMTTHDPGLMEVADKIYELEDGVLIHNNDLAREKRNDGGLLHSDKGDEV